MEGPVWRGFLVRCTAVAQHRRECVQFREISRRTEKDHLVRWVPKFDSY